MHAEAVWMELLNADRERWTGDLETFRAGLREGGVRFGDRDLCNHLRPKFVSADEYAALADAAEAVIAGIMKVRDRLVCDPRIRAMLGLSEAERALAEPDPGYSYLAPCVRLDAFLTEEGYRFVELNGECPAGPGYSDRLAAAFMEHPLTRAFSERVAIRYVEALPPLLETLLACWREWGGERPPRTIAIVDYEHVPTGPEFQICAQYFEEHGHPTVIADPRALVYDGDVLSFEGRPIDLVYKRVLMNEFIERYDEVRALFEAYRDHRVCVVNPFCAKLAHKKAIFAVLTADDRDEWLDSRESALIDSVVPWTRNVREGETTFEGERADLLDLLLRRREDFVLKPNDDYGGKGVCLGFETEPEAWEARVRDAVKRGDHVVQRRVRFKAERFPSMNRDLECDELFVDLDPYMYLGRMHGALARLGAGSLCNVTSGGGQVPMIVAEGGAD